METVIAGERYVVDEKGVRQAVLIDIDEWNRVVQELEDMQDALAAMAARREVEPTLTLAEYASQVGHVSNVTTGSISTTGSR